MSSLCPRPDPARVLSPRENTCPSSLPRSLLMYPGVGTSAKQSPLWPFLVELMGPLKALCAELWPAKPTGRVFLRFLF